MNFIDTNILVYAYDRDEKIKHPLAKKLLEGCWENGSGVLSTQVLQEFYVTITTKLSKNLELNEARELVKDYLLWQVERITPHDIISASEFQERYKYSFWDSLIITIAQKTGAETLYSEDLQEGQKFGELTIVNPFK